MEKNKEVEMSADAQEAIEILEWIRDNAGIEEFSNYGMSYGFIKSRGIVNKTFLDHIREVKEKIENRMGK